ncbi:MAG: RNA polymerase factor sigma-54 [Treponema sp.]|nr:RNA polymerase factor sigma-54 [Treponema sp.]
MSAMDFHQKQQQSQIQGMNQQQIQSLSILALGSDDLQKAVYEEAEKNPALIVRNAGRKNERISSVRVGSVGVSGVQASENYQNALEAKADMRQSLQDTLLEQLHMQSLPSEAQVLGERLIGNLDSRGYHILAPISLLDKNNAVQTESLLFKCMTMIQRFEPVGTCVKNMEESLAVQASVRKDCPPVARFILDGHFDFLNPPQSDKILKKIKAYQKERKSLFGLQEPEIFLDMNVTEPDVQAALDFIRTLDPYPARNYTSQDVQYIHSDVTVVKLEEPQKEDFDRGIITVKDASWKVSLAEDSSFDLEINPAYSRYAERGTEGDNSVIMEGIKNAMNFISAVKMRQSSVLRACCFIVKRQHEFFSKGPGHLVPLKQQDIANILGVHESTVSRMANSKYIECEWGLFDIKYFFVNAVSEDFSRDKVIKEIQSILEEHKEDKKKLSDQKISDILKERGINIARRTVAKYRSSI